MADRHDKHFNCTADDSSSRDANQSPTIGSEPADMWAALPASRLETVIISVTLLEETKKGFRRSEWSYLYQVLAVALPDLLTANAARKAVRDGHVEVDGMKILDDLPAPESGSTVIVRVGNVDPVLPGLAKRLQKFNAQNKREIPIRVLAQDSSIGWAVVTKPVGMHSNPNPTCYGNDALTFQDYLQAVVPPPRLGMNCKSPKVCHRLDFRVSGPVVVATSLQAERWLVHAFENHMVRKEYRAVVCGYVGETGDTFTITAPIDGLVAETKVEVLQVVPCPYFGHLSELRLWPITGRRQQLRKHCAIELGAPIVNEEPALFASAEAVWAKRHQGTPLPPVKKRCSGKLFLQAVTVSFPKPVEGHLDVDEIGNAEMVTVSADVSFQFEELLTNSTKVHAWNAEHGKENFEPHLEVAREPKS